VAALQDSRILLQGKEALAVLMRLVLCNCLCGHEGLVAAVLMAHAPLLDVQYQTAVTAFVRCARPPCTCTCCPPCK
jgi:hypothetical protein